jgi:hypothetical protein
MNKPEKSVKKLDSTEKSFWDSNLGKVTIAILIPMLVSIVLFQVQYSISAGYEQKDIANGFLNDISIIEPSLNRGVTQYTSEFNPNAPQSPRIDTFYPETGLYRTKSGDIGKLDQKLSEDLQRFYYRIYRADECREDYKNYFSAIYEESTASKFDKDVAKTTMIPLYYEIRENLITSSNQIPDLKERLKAYVNYKPFFLF